MAHIYETIIIGATPDGLALAEQLSGDGRKILIVSSNFIYEQEKKYNLASVEKLEAEAVLLSYSHGLFGVNVVTGNSNGAVFGTNLVIATGTKPAKVNFKNQNIKYKSLDIKGRHKNEPAVVYGNNDAAAEYALDLAKRFYYVYICTKEMDLACSARLAKKLSETPNIAHLPGCNIMSCKNDKDGQLSGITLDTYATINATALVFATERSPDLPSFTKRYIGIDADGFAQVDTNNESLLVPGVYAVGKVCRKSSKRNIKKIAETITNKHG